MNATGNEPKSGMKILFLAPHPFYRERGTPIAVNLLLRALSEQGHRVDVVTYHLGTDVAYPGITLHRIPRIHGIRDVPPGFSIRKLICDLWLLAKARRLAARGGYQLVHAVEESVFIAMLLKKRLGLPYVCDMDSSMPAQLVEKYPALRLIAPAMRRMEGAAVRQALAVVAVCDALAKLAAGYKARRVFLLRDVSLLEFGEPPAPGDNREALRRELGIAGYCFMYIGNLERYQGIDLLLEAFARLTRDGGAAGASLAIVGGAAAGIARYRRMAENLGIGPQTVFTGPQPVARMAALFQAADALVSPRIRGNNTPMKIYSYMASGRPILATDLPTHTQALTSNAARLAAPAPAELAAGMRALMENPEDGRRLAERARQLAEERHSAAAFRQAAAEIYQWLAGALATEP